MSNIIIRQAAQVLPVEDLVSFKCHLWKFGYLTPSGALHTAEKFYNEGNEILGDNCLEYALLLETVEDHLRFQLTRTNISVKDK